ncbi:MAG TPA: PH domain-containing protein [Chthoniobacterales bacterium]
MEENTHRAPWCGLLIGISIFATLLCLGSSVSLAFFTHTPTWGSALPAFPVLLIPASALFVVRRYRITPDAILVRRSFWDTRLSRAGLMSATFEPGVMRGSLRTFGNGGFFSFTGWYWNRRLRTYQAFVTDLQRTVVLRYESRTIVLSPENPEQFLGDLCLNKS